MPALARVTSKTKADQKLAPAKLKKAMVSGVSAKDGKSSAEKASKKTVTVSSDVKAKKEEVKSPKAKGKRKAEELKIEEPPAKLAKPTKAKTETETKKATATKATTKQVAMPAEKNASKPKKKKAPTPSPEPSEAEDDSNDVEDDDDEQEEDAAANGSEGSESEVLLHGFSSESDSSDEDDGVDSAPVDVGKLPTVAKDDKAVQQKLERAKRQPSEYRGVVYLGRVPHGFYEDQMKGYFSQFGDVTRLRLSRNKKTGRSKHYAFIEFSSSAVAEIVAETMDNYLLCGHILRCKLIPKEDVHPQLWIGANRKFHRVPRDRIERLQQNKERTDEEKERVERRLLKRQEAKKRKLKAAGIDYDIDSVGYAKRAKQSV